MLSFRVRGRKVQPACAFFLHEEENGPTGLCRLFAWRASGTLIEDARDHVKKARFALVEFLPINHGEPGNRKFSMLISRPLHENNYCLSTVVSILKIYKSNVEYHLYQLVYVRCFGVWLPQKLKTKPTELY